MSFNLKKIRSDFVGIASLFTSVSTLVCCALPIFLVTLGMGAVMAGLVSNFPFLVTLSEYKHITFSVGGFLIALNFWLTYRSKSQVCEIDENGNETNCEIASRWSKTILWISVGIYAVGFFASFLYLPIKDLFTK